MGRIAEPADRLIEAATTAAFDVIVVGSGYGGSVAARRCAEAGLRVAVVERGKEYLPGDFPRDSAAAPGHFRIDGGGETTGGYDDALYDLHVGDETIVVSGNGLGGGSLINAGVALMPERRVFAQSSWPRAIRDDVEALFARCESVRDELAAMPYVQQGSIGATPDKTIAFEAFGRVAQRDAACASVTVNSSARPVDVPGGKLEPCIGCGDCVSGCNYGAKATLGMTYLAAAYAHGARLFTNVSVTRLDRRADRPGVRWRVHFTRTTDQRSYQRAIARLAGTTDTADRSELKALVKSLTFEVEAPVVILAAGSLGSTEILQRSHESGLSVSKALGTRFSGNGDYLSFGYWQRQPVHAVGWGSRGNQRQSAGNVVGPTITRVIRFGATSDDMAQSFVVEDAAIPGALSAIFHELVTNSAILHQLERWTFKGADPIARTVEGAQHTQVFLAMGHDGSRGELRLARNGRTGVHWPTLDDDAAFALYDEKMSAVSALGATYLPNPAWTPIPRSMEQVLSGARFRGRSLIVHPLGGCPMGDDGTTGVVDHTGRVYMTRSDASTHPGLYVLDGAIVPTSLGANPLLTITVLAERAMPSVIDYARSVAKPREERLARSPRQAPIPVPPVRDDRAVPLTLHEVLRGELVGVLGRSSFALGAKLDVTFPTPNLDEFLADPLHRFDQARARLQLSPIAPRKPPSAATRNRNAEGSPTIDDASRSLPWRPALLATWHYDEVEGSVTILEPIPRSLSLRVLDTLQVLATWLIERGANEITSGCKRKLLELALKIIRRLDDPRRTRGAAGTGDDKPRARKPGIAQLLIDTLRLAWHSADRRRMRYTFTFRLRDAPAAGTKPVPLPREAPRELALAGVKDVRYAADWLALLAYGLRVLATLPSWALRWLTGLVTLGRGATAAPERPRLSRRNVWQTLTELDLRLLEPRADGNAPFAYGRLALAGVEMLNERPPQIHAETTAGLLGIAGYPLLFARYLLKCRIWDFRLPDYRPMPKFAYRRPAEGAALRVHVDQRLPFLRDEHGKPALAPECYELDVPRRDDNGEHVQLALWRYRNKVCFGRTKDGMTQCRSILLVHAFAQSAISFAEPTQEVNLAEYLHHDGWDVWLVEHRISIGLPSASQQCTMDDIGQLDIPYAVRRCLAEIERENPGAVAHPLQMFALAQCVGAASLAVALLGGALAAGGDPVLAKKPQPHVRFVPRSRSLLAGVAFSQFTPYVVGDAGSQFRTFLPTLLRDVFRTTEVHFDAPADVGELGDEGDRDAAAEAPLGQTATLLDRFLATLPRAAAEHCWDEHQGSAASQVHASCRRVSGIEAPLFSHEHLSRATHDRLPLLLGVSNLGVFVHARKCVEQERVVDADGLNLYVTADNIQRNLHMPVAFVHGRRNALFSVGSSRRSYLMLGNIFPKTHMEKRVRLIVFDRYGHLDWLIGKRAHVETYPQVASFFDTAWEANESSSASDVPEVSQSAPLFQLGVPAMGPVLGHVVREGDDVRANIWIRPEQTGSLPPEFVVVTYRYQGRDRIAVEPLSSAFIPLAGGDGWPRGPDHAPYIPLLELRYAVAQVTVPRDAISTSVPLELEVLTLHPAPGWKETLSSNVQGGFEKKTLEIATTAPPPASAPPIVARAMPHVPDMVLMRGRLKSDRTLFDKLASLLPDVDPHADDHATRWKKLLEGKDDDCTCTRLESARARLIDNIEGTQARIDRTVRSTLSRMRLRRVRLDDATCSISQAAIGAADAPDRGVVVVATCCRYPGFLIERHRVDATYRRLLADLASAGSPAAASMVAQAPAALFLVGDQIYADATAGLFDLATPIEKFEDRYCQLFKSPDARRLFARMPTYMAIDDHEIADDWDSSQAVLDRPLVRMAMGTARVHQWSHSSAGRPPRAPHPPGSSAGMLHTAVVGGLIPAMVLDTRSLRRARNGAHAILSDSAWDRLLSWLREHRETDAPKLIVTGSPIAPGYACFVDEHGALDPQAAITTDNWQAFDRERARLFDAIRDLGVAQVVLLSGDYHCSAVATIRRADRRIATAVIAPPSYAPLTYANCAARDIAEAETSNGYTVELAAAREGDTTFPCRIDGSGHARLEFAKRDGRWRLTVRFDVADVCLGADLAQPSAWREVLTEVDL